MKKEFNEFLAKRYWARTAVVTGLAFVAMTIAVIATADMFPGWSPVIAFSVLYFMNYQLSYFFNPPKE